MPNLNFHKIKKMGVNRYLTKVKGGYLWDEATQSFYRVWSGASEVSYYDGDRLIGVVDIDEGTDALHPSLDTTKEGYTLYGWSDQPNPTSEDRILTYVADGNPHNLYAIYLPNTLTVALSTVTPGLWVQYNKTLQNTKYVSGGLDAQAQGYNTWGGGDNQPKESSNSFVINLGEYRNASITVKFGTGNGESHRARFDGVSVASGEIKTVNVGASGSHTLWAYGEAWYQSWCSCVIAVTNITLSNPRAWT